MLRRFLAAVFIAMMLTVAAVDWCGHDDAEGTKTDAGQAPAGVRVDRDSVANVTRTPFSPAANSVIVQQDVPAVDVVHSRPSVVPLAAHTPIIKQQHVFRI